MRHHKLFEFIWLPTFERTSKAILDERLAEMRSRIPRSESDLSSSRALMRPGTTSEGAGRVRV
jgi:hypothetical protein